MRAGLLILVMVTGIAGGCEATQTYSDISGGHRGQSELQMDGGTCQMMVQNAFVGQPAPTTLGEVGVQISTKQNLFQSCMMSRGWQAAN